MQGGSGGGSVGADKCRRFNALNRIAPLGRHDLCLLGNDTGNDTCQAPQRVQDRSRR